MSTFDRPVRISEKNHTRLRLLSIQRKATTAELADTAIGKFLDREERKENKVSA